MGSGRVTLSNLIPPILASWSTLSHVDRSDSGMVVDRCNGVGLRVLILVHHFGVGLSVSILIQETL